ncbi:thioredoxin [Myxococcota bacterium]|nr:thioredoxin [Myxococcota bacterium]MBU1431080.1 thioredoxin [Myxococcota bacterium]MBU1896524.1 thioredoxin [Myxococcota bacterium]
MSYITVTDKSFQEDVLNSDVPVLVDFWAPWCSPCRAIAPHVEAISEEFAGRAKVAKMNIDENQRTPGQFGIRGIPTLLVFKGGEQVGQLVGMPPNALGRLRALINDAL